MKACFANLLAEHAYQMLNWGLRCRKDIPKNVLKEHTPQNFEIRLYETPYFVPKSLFTIFFYFFDPYIAHFLTNFEQLRYFLYVKSWKKNVIILFFCPKFQEFLKTKVPSWMFWTLRVAPTWAFLPLCHYGLIWSIWFWWNVWLLVYFL